MAKGQVIAKMDPQELDFADPLRSSTTDVYWCEMFASPPEATRHLLRCIDLKDEVEGFSSTSLLQEDSSTTAGLSVSLPEAAVATVSSSPAVD